ncbi:uncharacterized protein METZ01_LOCUS102242 [marine metagenome]|uniref:Uncharacterized protein n=1 Tax=marine metagenome TaxID=408172 RepID=A0A381WBJ7_9ZZZZ
MPKAWRVIDLINWAESYFKEKGFENPRMEIEWLLRNILKCDRMDVYLRFEDSLSKSQLYVIRSWVKRRLKHEPLQYITGSCDFYGRRFLVNEHVMIPRPETERLVDTVLEKVKGIVSPSILDVGTGSGCIASTLGLEIPGSTILGIDISPSALNVANDNKKKLATQNVSFEELNILEQIPMGEFDLLVSNPPYVPLDEMDELMKDVKDFEPSNALTDNNDGLMFYRRFSEMSWHCIKKNGWIILEVGLGGHPKKVKSIFIESGYSEVELIKDYNGDDRVLVVQVS